MNNKSADYHTWQDRCHYMALLLNQGGHTPLQIAKEFNVNPTTAAMWVKRGKFLAQFADKTGKYVGADYVDDRPGF